MSSLWQKTGASALTVLCLLCYFLISAREDYVRRLAEANPNYAKIPVGETDSVTHHHSHHGQPLKLFCASNGTIQVVPVAGDVISPTLETVCSSVFNIMCNTAQGPLTLTQSKPAGCTWCQAHPLLFFVEMFALPASLVIHDIAGPEVDIEMFRSKLQTSVATEAPKKELDVYSSSSILANLVSSRRLNKDWIIPHTNGKRGKADDCYWNQHRSKTVCPAKEKREAAAAENAAAAEREAAAAENAAAAEREAAAAEKAAAADKAALDSIINKVPESMAFTLTYAEADYVCLQQIVHTAEGSDKHSESRLRHSR